jgi:cyclopropane-fatty-acyl-phospholipid synthase
VLGGELPCRLRAWDGSEVGPEDAPVIVVKTPRALRRLLRHPGELGLAQAYVTGEIDVEGDLLDGFRRVWRTSRERGRVDLGITTLVPVLARGLARAHDLGVLGLPPAPPASQARLRGRLHSRDRDVAAIHHHYDLSNDFYRLILDERLAYSCAYWTSDDPDYTLADAQRDKLDLVCRKLGLASGMRLLDIGCGWGSLSLFAAAEYGVRVTAVTLAAEQHAFVSRRVAATGLAVDVRLCDYREITEGRFDAVSSIEMGEHVGDGEYGGFVKQIHALLRPEGRVLIQQMSRRDNPGGGPFIEAFIAPDMSMRPVGRTVEMIEAGGLEVRDVHALREHYVRTVHAWYETFESHWDEAVAMVGEEVARVWRLYLVGGALSFEEGRMGVDQILAVRSLDGHSGLPPVRTL